MHRPKTFAFPLTTPQLLLIITTALNIGLFASPARATTKVAILAGDKVGKQVAALAEGILTTAGQFAVVDRADVDRVVDEQKLSLVNVDAQSTLKVAQLLNADLFAVIEPGPEGSSPLAIVVFEAGSGLRLEDASLPTDGENAAQTVADAITAASQKAHPDKTALLSVCVVSVRNADLPISMDPLCEAIGLLLERRLIHFPAIGVLERRRLEAINKERMLPTTRAGDELWSSVITIDLEISRMQPAGFKAVTTLSNSKGIQIATFESTSDTQDPVALSNAVADAMAHQMKIAPAAAEGDAVLEARRFKSEANFLAQLHDYPAALRDAEAGMALHKEGDTQIVLIQCLLGRAIQLLNFDVNSSYFGDAPVTVPAAQALQSFALYNEAADIFSTLDPPALGRTKLEQKNALRRTVSFYRLAGKYLNDTRNLRGYGPEIRLAGAEMHGKFLSLAVQRMNAWKALAPSDEADKNCEAELDALAGFQDKSLAENAVDTSEYMDNLATVYQPWLDLLAAFQPTGHFPADVDAVRIGAMRDEAVGGLYPSSAVSPQAQERRKIFYKTLSDHPYPALRLYGFSVTQTPDAFYDKVCRTIENPGAEPADCIRHQCYLVALDCYGSYDLWRKAKWPFDGMSRQDANDRCLALARFMLARKEVDPWVMNAAVKILQEKDAAAAGSAGESALALVAQAKTVMDDPGCHVLSEDKKYITVALERSVEDETNRKAEAAQPATNPFQSVHALATPEMIDGGNLFGVTVVGDTIYAATMHDNRNNSVLRAWSMTTHGSALKKLGEITLARPTSRGEESFENLYGAPVCLVGGPDLFVRVGHRGLVQFPLEGGIPVRLDTAVQLPSPDVHAMAWLRDRLYVGLGDGGYLARIDPKAKTSEVLASARSTEARSALDHCDAYDIVWMAPDVPRNRVIMWVNNYKSKTPLRGFWQIDGEGVIQQVKGFGSIVEFHWASQPRDGKFIANINAKGTTFDLATEKIDVFYSWFPGKDSDGLNSNQAKFVGHNAFAPPYLLIGDSLWSGNSWAKIGPGHSPLLTLLPPDAKMPSDFQAVVCMESIEGDKALIVAGFRGIWRIDLN